MVNFSITVKGLDRLEKKISKLSRGLKDFKKPLNAANKSLREDISLNFATEGKTLDGGWKRLKKPNKGSILDVTGRMKNNFKSAITKTKLIISNPTKYFKYHQSSKPRRRLPRRVMLALKRKQIKNINKAFNSYIKSLLR